MVTPSTRRMSVVKVLAICYPSLVSRRTQYWLGLGLPRARLGTAAWRHVVALLIVILVLGQSLLCIAHCRMSVSPTHHSAPSLDNPRSFFLCDLPEPTVAQQVFVAAYWPGVPAALLLAVAAIVMVARCVHPLVSSCPLLTWAPPTPPPR